MTEGIVIRAASDADRGFIVGLVRRLLEFGSPLCPDVGGLAPGFGEVLGTADGGRPAGRFAQGAWTDPEGSGF